MWRTVNTLWVDIFENVVRFETDMDDCTQMSNVNETDQNELLSASQINQNEASSEASKPSSPPTAKCKKEEKSCQMCK